MSISIIVPVYNTENYIERCLSSIIMQDFQDFELIIVNDGSTDNSEKKIKKVIGSDARVQYFKNNNHGLSYTRNFGILQASKEYVLHIDSDDWIDPCFLSTVFSYAKENDLDMVVTDYIKDSIDHQQYVVDLELNSSIFIDGVQYLKKMFNDFDILPHAAYRLIRRSVYIENNISHPVNISLGEDLATTPILASKCKRIGKVNQAFYHYFVNENSISQSVPILKINDLRLCFAHLRSNLNVENIGKYELRNITNYMYFTRYNCFNKKYLFAIDYYKDVVSKNSKFLNKKDYHNLYYFIKPIQYLNSKYTIMISIVLFRLYNHITAIVRNLFKK